MRVVEAARGMVIPLSLAMFAGSAVGGFYGERSAPWLEEPDDKYALVSETELAASGWLQAPNRLALEAARTVPAPAPLGKPSGASGGMSAWQAAGWDQDNDGSPDVFILTPTAAAPQMREVAPDERWAPAAGAERSRGAGHLPELRLEPVRADHPPQGAASVDAGVLL